LVSRSRTRRARFTRITPTSIAGAIRTSAIPGTPPDDNRFRLDSHRPLANPAVPDDNVFEQDGLGGLLRHYYRVAA
jgi:hypothetical protein